MKSSYFKTTAFQSEFTEYLSQLRAFKLMDLNLAEMKKNIVVTSDEIEQHRYQYGSLDEQISNIKAQYEDKITTAKQGGNNEVAEIYRKERDSKIADITKNFTDDEHVRKKIIAEKEAAIEEAYAGYKNGHNNIPNNHIFEYYLVDTSTDKVYTSLNSTASKNVNQYFTNKNMMFLQEYGGKNKDLLQINEDYLHYYLSSDNKYSSSNALFNQESIVNNETKTISSELEKAVASNEGHSFKGFIGINKDAPSNNYIIQNASSYKEIQMMYFVFLFIGLLMVFVVIWLYKTKIKCNVWHKLEWKGYEKIPFDIRLVFLFVTAAFLSSSFHGLYFNNGYDNIYYFTKNMIFGLGWSTILLSLLLLQAILTANKVRVRGFDQELNDSLLYKLASALKQAFINRKAGIQLLILLVVVFFMGFGLMLAFVLGHIELVILYLFMVVTIGLPVIILILKQFGDVNKIAQNVRGIVEGRSVEDVSIKGISSFKAFAEDVNKLKQGVKVSQREQVKSERLKTELITNVSHDLRTPLTSIITYADLLKSNDLSEEDRNSYIEIIDRKSKRLKVLIDDLFEASKMATGNIELTKSKVDIVQLLQQALAEHDEKIATSDLHFRVSNDDQPIEAVVDGQKLWRVFDNLIGNILKYSLPHSRVYIGVKNRPDTIEITFKNVSQFELGDNVDELFERFKRGDQSRHTEGSGLGLAIAKSIIDLHEGEMDIDVDGDLFKVTIVLRK